VSLLTSVVTPHGSKLSLDFRLSVLDSTVCSTVPDKVLHIQGDSVTLQLEKLQSVLSQNCFDLFNLPTCIWIRIPSRDPDPGGKLSADWDQKH
jgi:hypothetical protein